MSVPTKVNTTEGAYKDISSLFIFQNANTSGNSPDTKSILVSCQAIQTGKTVLFEIIFRNLREGWLTYEATISADNGFEYIMMGYPQVAGSSDMGKIQGASLRQSDATTLRLSAYSNAAFTTGTAQTVTFRAIGYLK